MRKDDITRLVAIQGFSVQRVEFGREAIQVRQGRKRRSSTTSKDTELR